MKAKKNSVTKNASGEKNQKKKKKNNDQTICCSKYAVNIGGYLIVHAKRNPPEDLLVHFFYMFALFFLCPNAFVFWFQLSVSVRRARTTTMFQFIFFY